MEKTKTSRRSFLAATAAAGADFDYSAALTEVTLLGNVARRFPGRVLQWDAPNMKVANLPEAADWVRRPYRTGWSL